MQALLARRARAFPLSSAVAVAACCLLLACGSESPSAGPPPVDGSTPPARPDPASTPAATPEPVGALRGRVLDPYGAHLGSGVEVVALQAADPSGRKAEIRLAPAVRTDGEGRFELLAPELRWPLLLVASSGARHGSTWLHAAPHPLDPEVQVVAYPLVGSRVHLIDQDGEPVRWPRGALTSSVLAGDPRLEPLAAHEVAARSSGSGTDAGEHADGDAAGPIRRFLFTLRAEPGAAAPRLEWRLELPGYDYARVHVEPRPLQPDGTLAEQRAALERTVPGFGELELELPEGLLAGAAAGRDRGLMLVLEPRRGGVPLGYELRSASEGVALLRDVPAGAYRARLSVRGVFHQPPAGEEGIPVEVPVAARARLALEGPAWSHAAVEVELEGGSLYGGPLHLELRTGWVEPRSPLAPGTVREVLGLDAAPYLLGPLPAGRYTLVLRRLPGRIGPERVQDPFAQVDELDLPHARFELAPPAPATVRLRLAD